MLGSLVIGLLVGHILGLVAVRLIPSIYNFGFKSYSKEYRKSITGKEIKYYNRMIVYPLFELVLALVITIVLKCIWFKSLNFWIVSILALSPFLYHLFKVSQEKMSREVMTQVIKTRHTINSNVQLKSKSVNRYNSELDDIYNKYIKSNKYQKVKAYEKTIMRIDELGEKLGTKESEEV